MKPEYRTMKELGVPYGKTSHDVGKLLREAGYRTDKGRPSHKAFDEKFVAQRWADDQPVYLWAWHGQRTSALFERLGWKKVDDASGN